MVSAQWQVFIASRGNMVVQSAYVHHHGDQWVRPRASRVIGLDVLLGQHTTQSRS